MPFLFKNIRRRWLDRKSLSKYLSYAVGEIILVVIGILIALQINSCNQEKEHRRVENELLSKIKEDLEKDLMDFDMVKSFKSEQDRACKTLMTYFIQPSLELQDTLVTNNDLVNLKGLTHLKSLQLNNTMVTDDNLSLKVWLFCLFALADNFFLAVITLLLI